MSQSQHSRVLELGSSVSSTVFCVDIRVVRVMSRGGSSTGGAPIKRANSAPSGHTGASQAMANANLNDISDAEDAQDNDGNDSQGTLSIPHDPMDEEKEEEPQMPKGRRPNDPVAAKDYDEKKKAVKEYREKKRARAAPARFMYEQVEQEPTPKKAKATPKGKGKAKAKASIGGSSRGISELAGMIEEKLSECYDLLFEIRSKV